jgi:ketosteroid isomerase-like protein
LCKPEISMNKVAISIAWAMTSAAVQAQTPQPPSVTATAAAPAPMSAAECEVWNRELSFAHSVETHDAVAFAAHLQADTVFGAGTPTPMHGRAAVTEDWKDIIEGTQLVLRWRPGFVAIGGYPNIALSSGPAWTENPDPNAKQRYTISKFTSTWVKEADGQWRVLFDGAGAPPKPATAEDIQKLIAAQPATCPGG